MVNNGFFNERKKCPLCDSKSIINIFSKTFDDIKTQFFFKNHLNGKFPLKILNKKKYEICKCQNCHLLFQKNILNERYNRIFYNDYIDHNEILKKKNIKKIPKFFYRSEINLIDKIFNNKKISILEYGAGMGAWINAMREAGYKNICAVEISEKRRKFLKKNKINCYNDIKKINKKFDLVYSDQTFEHLRNPGVVFSKIQKILRTEGLLILKIPPGDLLIKKLNDSYVANKDEAIPLEHINIYTKNSVNFLKNKYNFENFKYFSLYHIYEKNFFRYFISYCYHQYFGKKFVLQKKNYKL